MMFPLQYSRAGTSRCCNSGWHQRTLEKKTRLVNPFFRVCIFNMLTVVACVRSTNNRRACGVSRDRESVCQALSGETDRHTSSLVGDPVKGINGRLGISVGASNDKAAKVQTELFRRKNGIYL